MFTQLFTMRLIIRENHMILALVCYVVDNKNKINVNLYKTLL